MMKLKLLSIKDRIQSETVLAIGNETQNWTSSDTIVSLSNVRLGILPEGIRLKRLSLLEAIVENNHQFLQNSQIDEIEVLNSTMAHITSLNSITDVTNKNQVRLENNIILSSCSSCENKNYSCFIGKIKKYSNISLPCQCEAGCDCNKGKSLKVTRLGVDRVKPWNSVRINLALSLRGLDIRPGLDNRHLILEGHRGLRRCKR